MNSLQDVLTIDPVAMNVVNRVCAGSQLSGEQIFQGGLLVQGELAGSLEVRGRLIVWAGVLGDLYLFGQLGAPGQEDSATVVECMGTAYIASTGISSGTLLAQRIRMYDGAQLQGPFKTLKDSALLPQLDAVA
jgi:cytoskeletal protein CcmA (bactofilin family)